MNLTNGQKLGLEMAKKLSEYKGKPQLAVLAGYAGTGKTTLLRLIAEEMGYPTIIAPTGKAALRVREATGVEATTIHSWMYSASENDDTGEVTYQMKALEDMKESAIRLLVIDEGSMVGQELWEDIYEMATMMRMNILIVGDPFQLPPVTKRKDDLDGGRIEFNLLSEHFMSNERVLLTEVVRQAMESPIIRASMLVRDGDPAQALFALPRIRASELIATSAQALRSGGVVICHSNETRNKLNIALRKALGKPDNRLVSGEPLLVLQNNYRLMRFNGEIATFKDWIDAPAGSHKVKDHIRKQEGESKFGIAQLALSEFDKLGQGALCEEQVFGRFGHMSDSSIHKTAKIIFGGNTISVEEAMRLGAEERNRALGIPFLHTNLGYAMTCHKAQGSEWPTVIVAMEPTVRLNNSDGRRWFYTALTRAQENVLISMGASF